MVADDHKEKINCFCFMLDYVILPDGSKKYYFGFICLPNVPITFLERSPEELKNSLNISKLKLQTTSRWIRLLRSFGQCLVLRGKFCG